MHSLEDVLLLPGYFYCASVIVWRVSIHITGGLLYCKKVSACVLSILSTYILFALQINLNAQKICHIELNLYIYYFVNNILQH